MAITRDAFELLCWAKQQNLQNWEHVLTLGRQSVILQPWDVANWEATSRSTNTLSSFTKRAEDASAGEQLFKAIGAEKVDSMDISDYEGASIIHNLNQPVPDHLKLAFDVVFDGGTLEHVFDYPTALKNALSMVKPGGWFLAITPSNMWCGHGFYQFSPEVFRTILSEVNGFKLKMMAFALSTYKKEYWIWDAEQVQRPGRLGIFSKHPACLLIAAQRISSEIPEKLSVQQPDYVVRWEAGSEKQEIKTALAQTSAPVQTKSLKSKLVSILPWSIRGRLWHRIAAKRNIAQHQRGLHRANSLV
ncbi:hypothetical protein SAMN02745166_01914 [Prosthecobacter debontii]|uniref:Methyltransferase domain-containing protein n=1 Tax=Prosthecobacter debontii TaxID=48467 RepID=A0A1T4XTS5_9BACT|nr:hypothetical protein [Prosthecobacter debontii]SKA92558.1 hypothetical protein SAMN02745166_01914 [Prosthecobacter debontii]